MRDCRDRGNVTLVGIAVAAALVFVALAAPALSKRPFEIDHDVKLLAERAQNPVVGHAMQAVSTLGNAAGLVPFIVLLSGIAWRHCRRYAVLIPVSMVGAGLLQFVAKWAIDRPRPNLAPWGFPSGHVLSLVVLLGLSYYLIVIAGASRRWCHLGAGVGAITLLAVAASRIYLDTHWLSDVVGGFAIGLAYLLTIVRVFPVRIASPVPR